MLRCVLTILLLKILAAPASAGPIERSCLKSDRPAASRRLCDCVEKMAYKALPRREIGKVAQLMRDPERVDTVKRSSRSSDRALWQSYKKYAGRAEASCRA